MQLRKYESFHDGSTHPIIRTASGSDRGTARTSPEAIQPSPWAL